MNHQPNVLLINGSPDPNGCIARAFREITDTLREEEIESEVVHVGNKSIRGCVACHSCKKNGRCIFDDIVNETAPKFEKADGLIVGSPVYYANTNATLLAFLQRLFYSTPFDKRFKVGAAVASARRGGTTATFDEMNRFFTISGMPIASGQYWNAVHGYTAADVEQDVEGLQQMRTLARHMAFLIKSIRLGKEQVGLPEEEAFTRFNFIR